ncbi:Uncharacterised protein [Vibrio cholerae]|nr:Uncharacterised protein [Vibrio cholerae]
MDLSLEFGRVQSQSAVLGSKQAALAPKLDSQMVAERHQ